jgi:hypothetical protein
MPICSQVGAIAERMMSAASSNSSAKMSYEPNRRKTSFLRRKGSVVSRRSEIAADAASIMAAAMIKQAMISTIRASHEAEVLKNSSATSKLFVKPDSPMEVFSPESLAEVA